MSIEPCLLTALHWYTAVSLNSIFFRVRTPCFTLRLGSGSISMQNNTSVCQYKVIYHCLKEYSAYTSKIYIKGIVQPKLLILSSFTHFQQKNKIVLQKKKSQTWNNMRVYLVWFHILFKIYYSVFNSRQKSIQVWNNMWLTKWQKSIGWTISLNQRFQTMFVSWTKYVFQVSPEI